MPLLATALGLSLLGSWGGLLVASSLLLFTENVRTRLVPWLVSHAVGALLGVALLLLLPEALETLKASDLIPDLHRGQIDRSAARQVLLIAGGVATVLVFEKLVG